MTSLLMSSPPVRWRHKIWSRKNVHIIFVSVTSTQGKGKRFLGGEIWVRPLFGGLASTQNVTDHKEVWYLQVYTNHNDGSFHKLNFNRLYTGLVCIQHIMSQSRPGCRDKLIFNDNLFILSLLVNYWQTPGQPLFRGHHSSQNVADHKEGWYLSVYTYHNDGSFQKRKYLT